MSLAEVLLVLGIVAVLGAITAPNLIRMRKVLTQKELDDKAEVIYHAVQSRLLQLRAAGQDALYLELDTPLGEGQVPFDIKVLGSGEEEAAEGESVQRAALLYEPERRVGRHDRRDAQRRSACRRLGGGI